MAETSYDGGIGGKFRKRPSRRASSTPYDRPPTAIRPTARAINSEGERSGWLSKFVDSAPRLLMSTASKLFPFRSKQLEAPNLTSAPDSGVEAREEAIRSTPDSSSVPNQSSNDIDCKESPNADSITEFEKLLGQKTFTRTEVDRLTELLRSRTVGSSEGNQYGPNASTPDAQLHTEENLSVQILEKRVRDPSSFGSNAKATADVNVSEKEIASPAELAKAYMGSRPSKLSTPITGLQSLAFGESTPLSSSRPPLPKTSDLALAPRSMIRVSGLSEDGYKTPRSQGRSAIYKMSRSPYFKTQTLLPAKGIEISENSGARAYSSHQLVPAYASDVKQVLKRRSSPMDSDVGSFGPIRRIRQKSNAVTQENELTRKYLSSPANNMLVSTSSIQKPFLMDAPSHNSVLGDTPRKSSQMAAKIFKQLDLLGSPPKEKASELDTINKDESPTKLSINMLRGQASMSLKDIDTSKLFNFEENKRCSTSTTNDHTICISQKVQTVESNGPIYSAAGTSRAGALDKPIITATAMSQKKPGFMMQVPETSSDGDAENPGGNDTRSTLHTGVKSSMQPSKALTFEVCQKKPPPSPETESSSGLVLIKESEKKSELPQVPRQDNGFSFPVTSSKSSQSQPPPTPTMPLATLKPHVESQGEVSEPVFSFGSGKATSLTFSAVASDANATVTSDPNADMFVSISTTRSTQLELPKFTKGKDAENSVKPFQNSTSSIFSGASSPSFNFGGSASSGLSNGSLRPVSSIFSASASPVIPVNGGISVAAASSSFSPTDNVGSSSTDALMSAPAVSSTSTSVGLSTTAVTGTAELGITKSATKSLHVQSSKETLFPMNNDLAVTTAAASASSVTGIFGLSSAASASTACSNSVQSSGSQKTNSLNGGSLFGQSASNAFGAVASSSSQVSTVTTPAFGFTTSSFGSSSTSPSPFSFGLSSGSGQDTSASFPGIFGAPSSTSLASSMTTPSLFGSSGASTSPMTGSSLFSSSGGAPLSSASIPTMFGSSSQPAASSVFSSGATSSSFSFGQSPVVPSSFGSSGTTFSFTSAPSIAAATSPSPASIFGTPAANTCASSSPGNDQMNVEDSMADDIVQGQMALPAAPAFGQAVKTNTPSTYSFGSPQPSGSVPFQFGSQPSAAFPAAQSPFQPTGNFDLGASGSFSLGSGGGDKSARKMIRVRKDNKNRKK